MDFQPPQGNNVLMQVNDVSDRAVPSTHDVRAENEMQEQSVGAGNSNGGFSDVNIGALIFDTNVMEEVEMTGLPSEEGCNAEISDPIAPFGDDDDFSFGGDDESDQLNCSDTSTQSMEVMWKFLSQMSVKWALDSILVHLNKVCPTTKMSLTLQDLLQLSRISTHRLPNP